MKKGMKNIIILITGIIIGLSFIISYASSYNSEEITYDNSVSHAAATNVKDAIDYLYSHGSCGTDMSCLESPIVSINVEGLGSVNVSVLPVPINGSNTITVTPNSGYVLQKVSCTGGFTVGPYKEYSNTGADLAQEIEISNSRLFDNGTCTITFGTSKITISSIQRYSSNNADSCNTLSEGCVCNYIKNGGSDFTYGNHTGCNIVSTSCCYTSQYKGNCCDCKYLKWLSNGFWATNYNGGYGDIPSACTAVITCET